MNLPAFFRPRLFAARRFGDLFPAVRIAVVTGFASVAGGFAQTGRVTEQYYEQGIRPLLKEYCLQCHSTAKHKGDLDLERFTSLNEVRRHPKVWERVVEQLSLGEMPPAEKPQPTAAERARLLAWVDTALDEAAQARAGDPGPVVLRRLNNAEYTYTVRDLTGLESLNPAKEFPVDSAAGEGFMNTGNALVMSPALITKYLDAGKDIASHAVLLPTGLRFSTGTTRRDWTEEILAEIRGFYADFTEVGGAETVTQQGMELDKNKGGRLPLEKYLAATLELRPNAQQLHALARQRGLSAKYLAGLWELLNRNEPSLLLDPVRARWRAAQPEDVASLAADIAQWQKVLWKFSSVGHIGKVGGPKAWMEPVNPLSPKQEVRLKLAPPTNGNEVVIYLVASDAGDGNSNDFVLWQGPKLVVPGQPDLLLRDVRDFTREMNAEELHRPNRLPSAAPNGIGLDPAVFGKHPNGSAIDPDSLCVQAPSVLEIHLPAELVAGAEFVTTGILEPKSGAEGSVQLQALTTRPTDTHTLLPGASTLQNNKGTWTDPDKPVTHSTPIIIVEGSATSKRIQGNLDEFRRWFPAALCYTKIVPVDEVVTLTLFYREDDHLVQLMLDDAQKTRLDRMWEELHYVSQDALTLVDAFEQLWQYATQDADPKVFEPMRKPINDRAAVFRRLLTNTQPQHVEGVLEFTERAYRRPLTDGEKDELRGLYRKLRAEELPHDEAIRLTLARVFVAPAFLYRLEKAAPGAAPGPVSDWELANRLSYFLWSTLPDPELRAHAAAGKLHDPDLLVAQARRMLSNPRVRRLAIEFACAWLHIHDFESLDEKSERHFPTFASLRGPMYEEAIRFFTDAFQNDASVLELFDTDHTFVNEILAQHYGIPGVTGAEWRRVEGVKKFGRGGILGLGATLAKQSGALRTSPILRGNWFSEVILGEKLPRPPKDVPRLPEDEATEALTVRQLTEKHTSDPRCAGCHARMDGYGFALEGYDSIGRARTRDLADRPIDTRAKLFDGTQVEGADGLRDYLLTKKRDVVLRQFCRKLLGYALGRSVMLSDKPLVTEMQRQLQAHDYRFSAAVETILCSKQFREIRGRDTVSED